MKKIISLLAIAFAVGAFSSCDPITPKQDMTGATTQAKIDQYVSATLETMTVGGKTLTTNNVHLVSDGLDALSSWSYGLGIYTGTNTTVQAAVVPCTKTIKFTALNGDGTMLTKDFTVTIDTCLNVAPEWALFCGEGSKVWTWDASQKWVWGNGGYLGNTSPSWWGNSVSEVGAQTNAVGEGDGATMTFSADGASLVKHKTDGNSVSGTFSFDMTKIKTTDGKSPAADGSNIWSIGKFYTVGVTVLCGKAQNQGEGPVNNYDIIKLDDQNLVLAWPETGDGEGAWGGCWFWMFKAQ